MRRYLATAWLALAACKSDPPAEPAPAPTPAVARPATDAAVATATDAAPPTPPPAPTYAETRAYHKALARGRALARRGKHAAAVGAFDAALAIIPGDARALSELSWAAFKAGALDRADDAARRSVAATGDVNLKAASLYNLGRVMEARGDARGAGAAYLRSYRLRPHAVVARRLEALGIAIPPNKREHAASLLGPHKGIDQACAALDGPAERSCFLVNTASEVSGPTAPTALAAPWRRGGLFFADGAETECRLALETARGWFLTEPLFDCTNERVDVTVEQFAAADVVPEGGAELVLVYTVASFVAGDDADGAWGAGWASHRAIVVCGTGADHRPRCAGPFALGYADDWTMQFDAAGASVDGAEPVRSWYRFEHRFDDAGILHITQGKRHFPKHARAGARASYDENKDDMGAFAIDFTGSTSASPPTPTPAP